MTQWQRAWLNCVLQLYGNYSELGYLTKEISKQCAERMARFLHAVFSKPWEETDKLREKLLSKKAPGLHDLENPQPIQIVNYVKIRDSTSRKHTLEPRV